MLPSIVRALVESLEEQEDFEVPLRGPVLVGTDLSEAAEEALRAGAELARALKSRLVVCHVIPELLPEGSLFDKFRRTNLQARDSILVKARLAVQAQVDSVVTDSNLDGIDVVLETGTPHVGLLRQADQTRAGIVVVWPGSAAADVVRHAGTAVLVVRRSPRGPVVGASDFSDPSLPALHVAADEARRRGVPLHLLHALDIAPFAERHPPVAAMPYLQGKSWIALEGLDELRTLAKQRLDQALHESGLPGETVILAGSAREVIVDYAESVGAELVVVGTHGRSGFKLLTLGSTASGVVARAPCSVLVARLEIR
jgi:nucleotide-binding universal stress UspA family protein